MSKQDKNTHGACFSIIGLLSTPLLGYVTQSALDPLLGYVTQSALDPLLGYVTQSALII